MITGKVGEIFIVDIEKLKNIQRLNLNRLNPIYDDDPLYTIVAENPHYRYIYFRKKLLYKNMNND